MPDTLTPLAGQLFVAKPDKETNHSDHVIIPEKYRKTSSEGVIVAMGELDYNVLKPGYGVLFASYAGEEQFLHNGDTLTVISENDVLGFWR